MTTAQTARPPRRGASRTGPAGAVHPADRPTWLASAVIEGGLASSARFMAVMDGDLQHDETRLPAMLSALRDGADLVVASRHVSGGDAAGLGSRWRHVLSDGGIRLAQRILPVRLSDPMSGYFMLPRATFERLAPRRPAGVQDPARYRADR